MTIRAPGGVCAAGAQASLSAAVDLADSVADGVRARDPDAIAACYEAIAPGLFRYVLGLCGDRHQAEDHVEATFVELIEYGPKLSGGFSSVRAWLFRAARNNVIDEQRKRRRRGDVPLERGQAGALTILETQAASGPDPESHAIAAEQAARVHEGLAVLSSDQREVLLLRFAADLTGPEVAELTGRTVGAVKALQHRGLASLARVLGTDPDEAATGPKGQQ